MSIAKDFVTIYMQMLPQHQHINRYVHKQLALTIGGALQMILEREEWKRKQQALKLNAKPKHKRRKK